MINTMTATLWSSPINPVITSIFHLLPHFLPEIVQSMVTGYSIYIHNRDPQAWLSIVCCCSSTTLKPHYFFLTILNCVLNKPKHWIHTILEVLIEALALNKWSHSNYYVACLRIRAGVRAWTRSSGARLCCESASGAQLNLRRHGADDGNATAR